MSGPDRISGDRSQHLRALERAWRDAPTQVFVRLAEAYHLVGRTDDAWAVLGHGLAGAPGHLAGLVLRARLAAGAGRPEEARRDLNDVLARFSDHHGALLALADLERLDGSSEAERDVLARLREQAPDAAILVRLAELDGDPEDRPRMPPARRKTAAPMTRPSSPVPEDETGADPTRADTIPSGPAVRPGMFVRTPPAPGGAPDGPDPFSNATMAELLASQGDLDGALAMFASLVAREPGRRSLRERYVELGGAAGDLSPLPESAASPAAELEQALRDLVEGR